MALKNSLSRKIINKLGVFGGKVLVCLGAVQRLAAPYLASTWQVQQEKTPLPDDYEVFGKSLFSLPSCFSNTRLACASLELRLP